MRDGKCPKCESSKIATTKFVLYLGATVGGPTINLFVCAECKYCEQYMAGSVEEKVKVLDAWKWVQREEGGPFRR